jgi:hypothetical protein
MKSSAEENGWESAFDRFFPWLTHISNCWMPVSFYSRPDFDVIHNGFPGPPFDATELASILSCLLDAGLIRFYKNARYPEEQRDLEPSMPELEMELRTPHPQPTRFGRMYVSLTDHGLEMLLDSLRKFGVGEWTRYVSSYRKS